MDKDIREATLLAGVELGGTKCIAVLGREGRIVARRSVPTGRPDTTIPAILDWFDEQRAEGATPAALGIASFGPLSLAPHQPDYGSITSTPKQEWVNFGLRAAFAERFDVPIGFDTDVAAAALAEGRWGAAQGARVHIYLTVGTGIGGGVVIDGKPVHGLVHPEVGHLSVDRAADGFPGICPFHGDCLEGLASGPAIAARAGSPAEQLAPGNPVWAMVATELGELVATLALIVSPERIVIGGGVVSGQPRLIPMIQEAARKRLAGYLPAYDKAEFVVSPGLGADAGPMGAIALAEDALR